MLERGAVRGALAASILLFIPGLLDPFESPKAMIVRIVGVSVLAGVLLHLVASSRAPRSAPDAPVARHGSGLAVDVGVAGWVVASLLATACSVSPRLSLLGELEQRDGLLTALGLAGLYVATRRSHARREDVRLTVNVLLASAGIAAVYALAQFTGHDPLAWSGATHYVSEARSVLRAFGTLGNPILLGAVLAPALGVVTARILTDSGRSVWWSILAGVLGVGLVSTLSRGAWLSAAGGIAAAVAGAAWYQVSGTRRQTVFALIATAVVPMLAAVWSMRGAVIARAGESLSPEAGSAQVRGEIAHAALALWRARPWLGNGPDTFGLLFPRVQPLAYGGGLWNGSPAQAHSVALQILATTGVLGAIAGMLWLVGLFARLPSRSPDRDERRESLEPAVGCVSLVLFGAFNHVGIAGAVVFVVLSALSCRGRDDASAITPVRARSSVGKALASGLAIALTLLAVPELQAVAAAGRARDAMERSVHASGAARWSFVVGAARESASAAARAPSEDQLWRLSCDAELALGREALKRGDDSSAAAAVQRAESSARRAVELQPLRAANFHALGNALAFDARIGLATQRPDAETAEQARQSDAAFAAARELSPMDALVLVDQTRAQLELGRAADARVTAGRIVQLYPDAATGHSLLAAAQLMLGEHAAALQSLRAAVRGRWLEDQGADEIAARKYLRQLESADSSR